MAIERTRYEGVCTTTLGNIIKNKFIACQIHFYQWSTSVSPTWVLIIWACARAHEYELTLWQTLSTCSRGSYQYLRKSSVNPEVKGSGWCWWQRPRCCCYCRLNKNRSNEVIEVNTCYIQSLWPDVLSSFCILCSKLACAKENLCGQCRAKSDSRKHLFSLYSRVMWYKRTLVLFIYSLFRSTYSYN